MESSWSWKASRMAGTVRAPGDQSGSSGERAVNTRRAAAVAAGERAVNRCVRSCVDATTQAFLAALIGALVAGGAVLAWHVSERQQQRLPTSRSPPCPPASPPCCRSCAAARSSSATTTPCSRRRAPAYAMGLVRGTSLVSDELAELVTPGPPRRPDPRDRAADGAPGAPPRHVTARVAPLGSRLVLALVEDRTRERRVEAVRRDFVANVSHELKTPVGAIRLLAEAVRDAADDPEAVKRFAGRMLTESDRLTRLVQQIIELSRLQDDDPLDAPVPCRRRRRGRGRGRHQRDRRRRPAASRSSPAAVRGLRCFGNEEQVTRRGRQPGRQRGRLLRRRLDGAGLDQGRRASMVEISVVDQGIGIPPRRARPHLRALLPRRPGPPPLHRRHRSRPVHRQARRGHPRRRRPRVVGRGPGLHVHPHPAPPRPDRDHQEEQRDDPGTRRRGRRELQRRPRLHAAQGGLRGRDRRRPAPTRSPSSTATAPTSCCST